MDTLAALFRRLRALTLVVIRVVQRVVMAVSLFFVYFLGIGASRLLAMVFQPRLTRWDPPDQDSYWIEAEGYDPDPERSLHQT
jgi:hypothetical protein